MSIGEPIVPSGVVETVEDAHGPARWQIGYPVIVRPAYTLGGTGGGIADNARAARAKSPKTACASRAWARCSSRSCIAGWKEIEFEVMRDATGSAITICSMENVDPVGIHTGDSIVVAPAQTLGEPRALQCCMPRRSRLSRRLASRAAATSSSPLTPTPWNMPSSRSTPACRAPRRWPARPPAIPIAKVATKLAVGYRLDEILNTVTGKTYACSEPAIDYVVRQVPQVAL